MKPSAAVFLIPLAIAGCQRPAPQSWVYLSPTTSYRITLYEGGAGRIQVQNLTRTKIRIPTNFRAYRLRITNENGIQILTAQVGPQAPGEKTLAPGEAWSTAILFSGETESPRAVTLSVVGSLPTTPLARAVSD